MNRLTICLVGASTFALAVAAEGGHPNRSSNGQPQKHRSQSNVLLKHNSPDTHDDHHHRAKKDQPTIPLDPSGVPTTPNYPPVVTRVVRDHRGTDINTPQGGVVVTSTEGKGKPLPVNTPVYAGPVTATPVFPGKKNPLPVVTGTDDTGVGGVIQDVVDGVVVGVTAIVGDGGFEGQGDRPSITTIPGPVIRDHR